MTKTKQQDKLYSTTAAAARLGISPISLRSYIKRGLIKPTLYAGSVRLFSESDLAAYQAKKNPVGRPRKR
jgi:DNA-binding transcriptional MerR regulator